MKLYKKDYPRPQLVRESWINLNGDWDFCFDDSDEGEVNGWFRNFPAEHKNIQVPFTYETKLSGIEDPTLHEHVWYSKKVQIDEDSLNNRKILLHFEGSDYKTKVWVNGTYIGVHCGAYERFSFEISHALVIGENIITVHVEDTTSTEQPRGKQRWLPYSYDCWYVQTTGIWKTVWMESVPVTYVSELKMTPDITNGILHVKTYFTGAMKNGTYDLEIEVTFDGKPITVSTKRITRDVIDDVLCVRDRSIRAWHHELHCWSPETPELYDITFRLKKDGVIVDTVDSYFGMREIRIENGQILLNGHPLYQRLILDQGYWEDSHLTPPSEQALIDDIDKMLALGYNGVRKHMKIEDERFLYWADVKGFLVWSEMAATYEYSDRAVENFTKEWFDIIHQNYNHPSIITWTPFNESWGIPHVETERKEQQFTEFIYHLTKTYDPMRPVVLNDGWEHTCSDIITLHDYESDGKIFLDRYLDLDKIMSTQIYHNHDKSAMANGYKYKGQPIIISEFGGIAFTKGKSGDWGYGKIETSEADFLARFDRITSAIKDLPYCVGYCYTQVSDVQQEINGLLDSDHNYKVAPEKIAEINLRKFGDLHRMIEE